MVLQMNRDEAFEALNRHLIETGLSEILKSRDFEDDCRILMNRSTLTQTNADSECENFLIW